MEIAAIVCGTIFAIIALLFSGVIWFLKTTDKESKAKVKAKLKVEFEKKLKYETTQMDVAIEKNQKIFEEELGNNKMYINELIGENQKYRAALEEIEAAKKAEEELLEQAVVIDENGKEI